MELIATHDSATGEKPLWYCYPLIPFARTQNKTIKQQYEAGCRSFDVRVKYHLGKWRCAHGLYFTKRSAMDILNEINEFTDKCYVNITYEGKTKNPSDFLHFVSIVKSTFRHIVYGAVSTKYTLGDKGFKVNYTTLEPSQRDYVGGTRGFLSLDGSTWHTYLPIPWLWNKLYTNKHKFNNNTFTYVDFL